MVVLCLELDQDRLDPDPDATARRGLDLRIVTAAVIDEVLAVLRSRDEPAGLAGFGEGGRRAAEAAAVAPHLVSRLALIATPAPLGPGAAPSLDLPRVQAKALIVAGGADPDAGSRHARWWQQHLPNARLEMTPRLGGRELLVDRWDRVLSFLAPGSAR